MDVDKKLGMSLEDLIKKTRKDAPKRALNNRNRDNKQKNIVKKAKLGVRRAVGKKGERNTVRATGKTGAVVSKGIRRRRSSNTKMDVDMERKPRRDSLKKTGSAEKKSFSRKVVIKKGPNAPADQRRKVKITNVPYDLTWKDIKQALSEVGQIERCDVVERGEARVTFGTHKEAARAIQTYNNGDMNGRKIRVFFE